MKILHIVRQFYPMVGGMENFVMSLANQQIENGHEISVLTLDRNFMNREKLAKHDSINGISVIRIPYIGSKKYPLAFSCIKYLKGNDVIHIHGVDFFVDYLSLTKKFHRSRLICHTHGGYFHTQWGFGIKKVFFNTISRLTFKFVDKVIAISSNDYTIFNKITQRIVLIYNGVNVEKYDVTKEKSQGTLITVGRIDIHKRVDNLIKVVLYLNENGTEAKLRIVGPDWKGLQDKLNQIIPSKYHDKVIFVGKVNDSELTNEYRQAHLFVSASEYEGFGLTAIEALASGTMVILNDIESFNYFLKDQQFGEIVNFNNIPESALAIKKLLELKESEYEQMSDEARKYASRYSWVNIEKEIYKVYLDLIS